MPHQLKGAAVGAAELVLAGAGLGPGQITLAALSALRRCRLVLLVNVPGDAARELSRALPCCEDLSALHSRAGSRGDDAVLERVGSELERGGAVGVVLAGHPLLYAPGARLAALAAGLGARRAVLPGLSALDGVMAAVEPLLSGARREAFSAGLLVCDPGILAAARPPLDRRRSTLVLNLSRGAGAPRRRALERLRDVYGPRWEAFLVGVGPGGGVETLSLSALAARDRIFGSATTLFVPARAAR